MVPGRGPIQMLWLFQQRSYFSPLPFLSALFRVTLYFSIFHPFTWITNTMSSQLSPEMPSHADISIYIWLDFETFPPAKPLLPLKRVGAECNFTGCAQNLEEWQFKNSNNKSTWGEICSFSYMFTDCSVYSPFIWQCSVSCLGSLSDLTAPVCFLHTPLTFFC